MYQNKYTLSISGVYIYTEEDMIKASKHCHYYHKLVLLLIENTNFKINLVKYFQI